MEKCEQKVEELKACLDAVVEQFAGCLSPEELKKMAPTLGKHCSYTSCAKYFQFNISSLLKRSINKSFKQCDLEEKFLKLEQMKTVSMNDDFELSNESDPSVIKKHWLLKRRKHLRDKLKQEMEKSDELRADISRRRLIMENQMKKMEEVKYIHNKDLLL